MEEIMKSLRPFLVLVLLLLVSLFIGQSINATSSQYSRVDIPMIVPAEGVIVLFPLSTDTSVAANLPALMGQPDQILAWHWLDDTYSTPNGSAGKAKAAYAAGEAIYCVWDEYCDYAGDEYAGSSQGNLSIYRADFTDGSAVQDSVACEIWFGYR
jgi:hypothetical protein